MNKGLIVGFFVLIVFGVIGYFVFMGGQAAVAPSTSTSQMGAASIEIKNFSHNPETLVVKPGETVTVTNRDIVGHTVTSDQKGLFDTGLIGRSETKTFIAPTTPGEYAYHCTPHPFMKAVLIVKE